jgi:outer membrane receptor protein involved in Fe transport
LTARTDTAAEVAEVAAAKAAAAEAAAEAAAVEAVAAAESVAAVESAAAAGATAKAVADAPGAEAAFVPELPKEPGGGTGGIAEGAQEIPGRPVFRMGAREELKIRGESLSSEGANGAAQAERSSPIKFFRSPHHSYALVLNEITTLNLLSEFIFMVVYPHGTMSKILNEIKF